MIADNVTTNGNGYHAGQPVNYDSYFTLTSNGPGQSSSHAFPRGRPSAGRRADGTISLRQMLVNGGFDDLTENDVRSIAKLIGTTVFDPRRDIADECGYPADDAGSGFGGIDPEFYRALYEREPIATRVVECLPKESWQINPWVYEDEDPETVTEFEEAFDQLGYSLRGEASWFQGDKGNPLWEYLERADILSGIGHFGVILVGIDDGKNLDQPVDGVVTLDPTGNTDNILLPEPPFTPRVIRNAEGKAVGARMVVNSNGHLNRVWPSNPVINQAQSKQWGQTDIDAEKQEQDKEREARKNRWNARPRPVSPNPKPEDQAGQDDSDYHNRETFDPRDRPPLGSPYGPTTAAYCPTGEGGRVDPSCSPSGEYAGRETIIPPEKYSVRTAALKTREGADAELVRALRRQYPVAIPLFHEAPVGALETIKRDGLKSSESAEDMNFFSVGKPSQFVTTQDKVIVVTHLSSRSPEVSRLIPDMRYDPDNPAADLLREHRGTFGAYVAKDGSVPPEDISAIHIVRDGKIAQTLHYDRRAGTFNARSFGPAVGNAFNPVGDVHSWMGEPYPGAFGGYPGVAFEGARGTDAQYVGIQLSPPQFPARDPSKDRRRLLFLRCFDESLTQIVQYEADVRNPRFGQPVMYRITLNDPREMHSGIGLPMATVRVHWSRVIHLADNRRSSEIFGAPRLRPVLNRILDLRKVYGASGEGYWRSAITKLSFETHPQLGGDVYVDDNAFRATMEDFGNGLQNWIRLSGMSAKTLAPAIVDPTPHVTAHLEAICIQLAIPVRVFKGSERGELASGQDDAKWNDVLRGRENGYLTPRVVVPTIDRFIQMGVLPVPGGKKTTTNANGYGGPSPSFPPSESNWTAKRGRNGPPLAGVPGRPAPTSGDRVDVDSVNSPPRPKTKGRFDSENRVDSGQSPNEPPESGYFVVWPDLDSQTDKDKSGIALQKTQALGAYVQQGVENLIDPTGYLINILGMDEEVAKELVEKTQQAHEDEETMTTPPMVGGRPGEPQEGSAEYAQQQQRQEQFKAQQQQRQQQFKQMQQQRQQQFGAGGKGGGAAGGGGQPFGGKGGGQNTGAQPPGPPTVHADPTVNGLSRLAADLGLPPMPADRTVLTAAVLNSLGLLDRV
jgi:hypothetical protein